MIPVEFWEGLAAGLAIAVAGGALLRWLSHRLGAVLAPMTAPPDPPPVRPPPTDDPPPAVADPPDPLPITPAPLVVPPVRDVERTPPVPPPVGRPAGSDWEANLRLSQRILLHLWREGRGNPEDVAPRALCQSGMIEALGVRQGALTGALRRLIAAGVVHERREHARGVDRRVKVYRLTSPGMQLVAELRSRKPPATGRRTS